MSEVVLRFQAKDDGLTNQFRRVNQQLDSFGSQARGIADSIGGSFKAAGIAGVATAAAAAIKGMVSAGLEFGESIQKVRDQTGFTAEEVQKLNLIAGRADVDLGSATNAALKLQKVLGGLEEGGDGAADTLARLNLNTQEFKDSSPAQQFDAVARAIAGVASQNERVAITTALFSKAGGELLPVIVSIGKESAELEQKMALIGGPVGADVIDKVDKIGDEMTTTTIAAKTLAAQILATFEPAVSKSQSGLQEFIGAVRYQLFGANDEAGKLDDRMRELQDIVDNPIAHGSIFDSEETFRHRVEAARKELERLGSQWRAIHGFGMEGIGPPLIKPNVNVPIPLLGANQFEETDADRKAREELEGIAAKQRLQHYADEKLQERDLELKHQIALAGIDQDALDRSIDRENAALGRRAHLQSDYQEFLAAVRQTFGLEEITFEKIKSQSIIEIAASMFGALAAHNSKLAKIQQGIALAETIWATATGIMKAFQTYGPTPAGFIAAAKVALTGAIQVMKIRSTNYTAGSVSGSAPTLAGGGTSIGGSTDTPAQSAVASAQGATTVYVSGFITQQVIDQLLDGLRDGFNRDVIIIPSSSAQAQLIRGTG